MAIDTIPLFWKGIFTGFMLGGIFWFVLGGISFALIVYFHDIRKTFRVLRFMYKSWKELKKEDDKSGGNT